MGVAKLIIVIIGIVCAVAIISSAVGSASIAIIRVFEVRVRRIIFTIRIAMGSLRVLGRATQGVRLIRLAKEDQISSIAKIEPVVLHDASS